jgi:hypothetical protein
MSLSLRLVVIGVSLVRKGWLVATGHILRPRLTDVGGSSHADVRVITPR